MVSGSRSRNFLAAAVFVAAGLFMPDLGSVRRLSTFQEDQRRRLAVPAGMEPVCSGSEELFTIDWSLVTIDLDQTSQTIRLSNGMDVTLTLSHTTNARFREFLQTPSGFIKTVVETVPALEDLINPAGGSTPDFPAEYVTVEIDFGFQVVSSLMVSVADIDSGNIATDVVRVRMFDSTGTELSPTTAVTGTLELQSSYAHENVANRGANDPGGDAALYAKSTAAVQKVLIDQSIYVFYEDEVGKDPSQARSILPAMDLRFCAIPSQYAEVPSVEDLAVGSGVCLDDVVIHEETFPYGSTAVGWSNGILESSQGFSDEPGDQFLGRYDKNTVEFPTKTFEVPIEAERIDLTFDFYEIDSWDADHERYGQDFLQAYINDHLLDIGYFRGVQNREEAKNGVTDIGIKWWSQPYGESTHLGFNSRWIDQKHLITAQIPKRVYEGTGKITVQFAPHVSQSSSDESAGFDNIKLTAFHDCSSRFNVCKNGCAAYTSGDPHIVTFDGRKFDCQARGEFVLLKSLTSSLMVQGRFQKIDGTHPANDRVSYTTGIAISYAYMPKTQLIIATVDDGTADTVGGCPVRLFVDGAERTLASGSGDERVDVASIGSVVTIDYPDLGIQARIKVKNVSRRGCFFRQTKVFSSQKLCEANAFVGLFGVPNNDVSDEWNDATGEGIVFGGRKGAVAFNYCTNNWCVTNPSDSLFTYETGTDFSTFGFCSIDTFDDDVDISDPTPELAEICGADEVCLTDGTIGEPEDGRDALVDQQEAVEEQNEISSFKFSPTSVSCDSTTSVSISLDIAGLDDAEDVERFALYSTDSDTGEKGASVLLYLDDADGDDVFTGQFAAAPIQGGSVFAFTAVPVIAGMESPASRFSTTALNAITSYCDGQLGGGSSGGVNGDPLIMGLKQQVFKFDGRSGSWYSAVSAKSFQWNMRIQEFEACPEGSNRFVNGVAFTIFEKGTMFRKVEHQILINVVNEYNIKTGCGTGEQHCLGGGSLELIIDGEKLVYPGDYRFRDERGRVIAFNTFYQCARKWYDFDITPAPDASDSSQLRNQRKLESGLDVFAVIRKMKQTMVDKDACNAWIADRRKKQDLFQQPGEWSTIIVKTESISFHVEYKQENKRCGAHSVDVWISSVSDDLLDEKWEGVIGETRYAGHENEKVERNEILRCPNDEAYEVVSPFSTKSKGCGHL